MREDKKKVKKKLGHKPQRRQPIKSSFPTLKGGSHLQSEQDQLEQKREVSKQVAIRATESQGSDQRKMVIEKNDYFHTRIARIPLKEYERLYDDPQTCVDMLMVYKIRIGLFCDCDGALGARSFNKKIKKQYNLKRGFNTCCLKCGKKSLRSLYKDTPLSGKRLEITKIFKGFYFWRRSKATDVPVDLPEEIKEQYYKSTYVEPGRQCNALKMAKDLDIKPKTAKSWIKHYRDHFPAFWSRIVILDESQ